MHISLFIKENKAEMSFLRFSDLLLVCVDLNHDADSSLYTINMIFSLKINEKLRWKSVSDVAEDFDSLAPCLKLKMTSSMGHIMSKYG